MATVLEKSLLDIHPRELKGMVNDIPTLPAIYEKLFDKLQDPDVSVPEIAEIITQDQALSAKILHLVNSALYGPGTNTMTISRAVVILGFRAVRGAAMASGVFDYFKDEESSEGIDMIRFWEHSIAVASISKVVAMDLRLPQRDEAFVAGLLHDIGKLIEKTYFAADFDEICVVADENKFSWYEAEKELFPIHHGTIGKTIFRSWKFSPNVVDAVQFLQTERRFDGSGTDGPGPRGGLHGLRAGVRRSGRLRPQGVRSRCARHARYRAARDPGLP